MAPLMGTVPSVQVYADMSRHQVLTNNAIVVAFLAACAAAAPLDTEQLSEVFRLVAAFRASHKPKPQLYTALLTLSSRSGMQDRARGIWHAIQQVPSTVQHHGLLSIPSCVNTGQPAPSPLQALKACIHLLRPRQTLCGGSRALALSYHSISVH